MTRVLTQPLVPFVDTLPVPPRLFAPQHGGRLTVAIRAGAHRFHRDLPESRIWGFDGTVPGPTIRVHLGDTVRVHLTNHGSMSHSIDFHASQTAMDHQMVDFAPGETLTYEFTADYAGVWMYHCGTSPALNSMRWKAAISTGESMSIS